MKGIILAGGWGTRMLPATKTNNKHLLPVYSKDGAIPMIEYPIKVLKNIGITEIMIITSREHCGIIVEYLGDGNNLGLDFTYKIQEMDDPARPPGIASALKLCKHFTNTEDFIVILGDNFYEWNDNFKIKLGGWHLNSKIKCGLFLNKTEDWVRFGCAKIENGKITGIIEKPKEFISDLAVTGMYYYTPEVYDIAKTLQISERGELEISHINDYYAKTEEIDFVEFDTFWSDMGVPESMFKTQEFVNKNEQ